MPIALTPSLLARRKSLLLFAPPPSSDTIATGPDPVSEIRAFQMGSPGSGNSHVILQVRTQSGLVGYGECNTLSASDLKATNQAVVGHAPSAYQALDGLVPQAVRGGLNIALLDIVGKATKAPIYRVLGGPTRNKARAITRLNGSSDEALRKRPGEAAHRGLPCLPHPGPPAHCPQSGQRVCSRCRRAPQSDAYLCPHCRFRF